MKVIFQRNSTAICMLLTMTYSVEKREKRLCCIANARKKPEKASKNVGGTLSFGKKQVKMTVYKRQENHG